jgi:hypothetical protein
MAEGYDAQIKALLANKDSLTKKMTKDGRSEYAVQINKLKKKMKADGQSFSKVLKGVKKQEREGKFDRGAEGKTKKKLRAKMAKEPQTQLTKGVHKGSRAAESLEKGYTYKGVEYRGPKTSEESVDLSKALAGETDKERKTRKETKKRKQTPGHSR